MSATLAEILGQPPLRETVITELVGLIDAQVKAKGFMLKSAYATIKALKKKFVPETVDAMLDEWLNKIQPDYAKWSAAPATTSFADYLIARSDDVAESLLQVTDERAEKTSHGTAKKWYLKMRDTAKKNVVDAVPELARLIGKHLPARAAAGATAATPA